MNIDFKPLPDATRDDDAPCRLPDADDIKTAAFNDLDKALSDQKHYLTALDAIWPDDPTEEFCAAVDFVTDAKEAIEKVLDREQSTNGIPVMQRNLADHWRRRGQIDDKHSDEYKRGFAHAMQVCAAQLMPCEEPMTREEQIQDALQGR